MELLVRGQKGIVFHGAVRKGTGTFSFAMLRRKEPLAVRSIRLSKEPMRLWVLLHILPAGAGPAARHQFHIIFMLVHRKWICTICDIDSLIRTARSAVTEDHFGGVR